MKATKIAPVKPAISLDILNRIDIRVGTIELVEDLPVQIRPTRIRKKEETRSHSVDLQSCGVSEGLRA